MRIGIFALGFSALLLGVGAAAAEPPPPVPQSELPPPPPPERRGRKERGLAPFIWRAFSRLTEPQRQEMLQLQRSDPEQFRQKMRELGEALRREDMARFAELRKAAEAYRASQSEEERAALKERIAAQVRARYLERLEDNKRQLDAMKRRAKSLEEELARREANADRVVEARVEAILNGELPEPDQPPPPKREP